MKYLVDISEILKIPSDFLKWPLLLTNVIIPFIFFWYAMKCFLDKISIFRNSFINWSLAFIISFYSIFFVSIFNLVLTPIAIIMIGLFKLDGKSRIFFIIICIIFFLILNYFLI